MKLSIATNQKLKKADIEETKDFTGFDVVVTQTKETIKPNFHTNNQQWYGDFDHVRSLFTEPTDARCFVTSRADLIKKGITQNIAAYDIHDNDTVYDFYIGLSTKLDRRAKANGFKSNLAWEVAHEMCHGAEWYNGNGRIDRVHGIEAQGKLKDLWRELFVTLPKQKEQLNVLQTMLAKLLAAFKSTTVKTLQPLVERQANEILRSMDLLGMPMRVTEGYRSIARQNELYAQGRTTKGNIVTQAKGGESLHNYGVAVDFVFLKGYDVPESQWNMFGTVAVSKGFEWGGSWKGFVDKPHVEMRMGYSLKDFQENKVNYTKYK